MPRIPTIIDAPDGTIRGVNIKRLAEIPYFLLGNTPNNIISMLANQSSEPVSMSISGEGPAQLFHLAAERLAPCKIMIQIQDGQGVRALMNKACHVDTIFGNYNANNRPYTLPEALYLDEQRQVIITATDISGADNTFRPSLDAQRLLTRLADHDLSRARAKMEKRQYLSLPSFYTLDNGSSVIAANGTNVETITVGQESHFDLVQITAVSTGVFDMEIVNISTGESMTDGPLAQSFPISSNLCSSASAGFPFKFHEPLFVELKSKLQITLTDRSGAPNTVFVTFGGSNLADRMWQ
ncbi:MAG: hypothetical protein GZ088_09710 [Acidipila sp.]|nr:hypothetical protein [Acidipila sp.]